MERQGKISRGPDQRVGETLGAAAWATAEGDGLHGHDRCHIVNLDRFLLGEKMNRVAVQRTGIAKIKH
jgi:hypothetical protein